MMVEFPIVVGVTTRSVPKEKSNMLFDYHEAPDIDALMMFIDADSDEKMREFAREWQPLLFYSRNTYIAFPMWSKDFGEYNGCSLDDYKDARSLMMIAIQLKSLLDCDQCSIKSLSELGFEFDFFGEEDGEWYDEHGEVQMRDMFLPLLGKNLAGYLMESSRDLNTPVNENQLIGVSELDAEMRGWFHFGEDIQFVFNLATVPFPVTHDGLKELTMQAIDELITLHLYDVRTVTTNGGVEYRKCGSLLSTLWYLMIQSFSEGRVGRCIVCRKPYISIGERGKPRKYCSQRCNKWAQRHPGETRF